MKEALTDTRDALALIKASSPTGVDLRRFECLPGCGRCCGYKVSLLEEDITRLEARGLKPEEFLDGRREPAAGFAGCLRKSRGYCLFLDSGKRCRVYEQRPLYCRLYPYIRESYLRLQLDVDLSCPGIGRGRLIPEAELLGILASDASAAESRRRLELQRKALGRVEKLLAHRAHLEPFEVLVDELRSAAEGGLEGLRNFLSKTAHPENLLPATETPLPNCASLESVAEGLLRDYLLFWSSRQVLWRWTDAVLAVTPAVKSRSAAMSRFLLEISDIIISRAFLSAGGDDIRRENILAAIRECDSSYRTYCQAFRLEY